MGLAVDAHIGDGVEPVAGGGVERAEVGDVESGEEVLLHVTDAGLDAAFLVPGADVARCDLEVVMAGEVGVAGVEHRRLTAQALQHRGLQVVDHDFGWDPSCEGFEGVHMAAEEVLHGLGDGELEVHQAAVAEHHHEEAQPPAGVADVDAGVVTPVDLGALTGGEVQGQERGGAHRADPLHVVLDDGHAPVVAGLAQAVEGLRGAVWVVLEQSADVALVGVELARARWGGTGSELRLVKPAAHRARVHRHRVGDLGDGELLDVVQMLDALIGRVIDHVGVPICRSTSLRRRGVAPVRSAGVAGASLSSERT